MITYDGLRVLKMAEDDSRGCLGLFVPPSQPKNLKIRPRACFFIARLMVMLPNVEISLNKKKRKPWLKIEFLKIENIVRIDAPMYFLEAAIPKTQPKYQQQINFKWFFQKIDFYGFYDLSIKKGPLGAHVDASNLEAHLFWRPRGLREGDRTSCHLKKV